MSLEIVAMLLALVFSVVLHELSHGLMANYLGDPTAKLAGRLTLNPAKHIDPFGSVILPGFLLLMKAPFLFGWAKPVPYNPHNLQKGGRFADALVAFAGPLSNFLLAFLSGVLLALLKDFGFVALFLAQMVVVNIVLGVFNMLPIPPLDGSKIFPAFLPISARIAVERAFYQFESNPFLGLFLVFGVVYLFGDELFTFIHLILNFFLNFLVS